MSLFGFMLPTIRKSPTPQPMSLLERHLCFCMKTRSIAIDRGLAVWIVHSAKPRAGRVNPWPATELEICRSLGWSEEHLLQVLLEYIKAHHYLVGEADYLFCRILNECEERLGLPVSAHPFQEKADEVVRRIPLLKSMDAVIDPSTAAQLLKKRYRLSDTIISGRNPNTAREVVRLIRPILMGLARHPRFLYFEVDNEPWGARHQTHGISCWLNYTVIHAHFEPRRAPITLCVFDHHPPANGGATYYILTTHNERILDYLRSHM